MESNLAGPSRKRNSPRDAATSKENGKTPEVANDDALGTDVAEEIVAAEETDSGTPDQEDLLTQKDELIAALTARLEEAANQLDRLHRSGADRGAMSRGGGSLDFLEEQRRLAEKIDQGFEAWEAAKLEETLARIDQRIEAIYGVVVDGTPSSGGASPAAAVSRAPKQPDAFWEETKARLLERGDGGGPVSPAPTRSSPPSIPVPEPEESPPEDEQTLLDISFDPDEEEFAECPEAPEAPPEDAESDVLWEHIERRDAYIAYLTAKLRDVQLHPLPDWERLNNVPDALQERLEKLATQLEEQLKEAEIAHALERATITRERGKLLRAEAELERLMARATPREQQDLAAEEIHPDRRWLRRFMNPR